MTAALFVISGCGNVARTQHDAGAPDDAAIDSPIAPPDTVVLREAREIVSGSTRMAGATYTLDIEVGHGVSQSAIAGATYQLEGNAAVKPGLKKGNQ
ncbi:MAG: hypothetical protein ACREBE_15035 [bacterium]